MIGGPTPETTTVTVITTVITTATTTTTTTTIPVQITETVINIPDALNSRNLDKNNVFYARLRTDPSLDMIFPHAGLYRNLIS